MPTDPGQGMSFIATGTFPHFIALRAGIQVVCNWEITATDPNTTRLWDYKADPHVDCASLEGYYEAIVRAHETPGAVLNGVTLCAGDHEQNQHSPVGNDPTLETECTLTIFKVEVIVNEEGANDNYVVKKKTRNDDVVLWTAQNGQANEKGASDNHVPLTVNLLGPAEFSCKVRLIPYSDHGAEIEIKTAADEAYPNDGATMTGGSHLHLKLYGVTPSTELWDEIIIAKTDKTGEMDCSYESLTVIWVDTANMIFRGRDEDPNHPENNHQDEDFDDDSAAHGTNTTTQKIGLQFGPVDPVVCKINARLREEIAITITPNVVMPNVTWGIERDVSARFWANGIAFQTTGPNGWVTDGQGVQGVDLDLLQDANCTRIFTMDSPGLDNLPLAAGATRTLKGKFREWVEIKIGTKWYVCSNYYHWRAIMHVKYQDNNVGWVPDGQKVNEVLPGTINGFPVPDNWQE